MTQKSAAELLRKVQEDAASNDIYDITGVVLGKTVNGKSTIDGETITTPKIDFDKLIRGDIP